MVKVHFYSPLPKMPFGIFLFSLKSEFQEKPHFARKVPKNGEKRRKPEKISGFSVGIFFVKTHWRRIPEFRALREYSHTLRLASELVTSLACVSPSGECEPDSACGRAELETMKGWCLQKEQARDCVPVLFETC